jgi:hypothetical protein
MPYPELRHLRVPGLNLANIHYSPQFAPYKRDLEVLTNPHNVLHYKIRDRYARLPKDTLRWQVFTVMSVKVLDKAVTRERLRRRHKEAFREALKRRGYDKDGKLLDGPLKSPNAKPLFGTFEVHVHGGLGFHLKFPVLVQQAGLVIDAVQRECQKNAGRNFNSFYRYGNDIWTQTMMRRGA